jgi:hypothetical protein
MVERTEALPHDFYLIATIKIRGNRNSTLPSNCGK